LGELRSPFTWLSSSLLSWDEITFYGNKCGLNKVKLVQAIKYLECLGHLMYFPGGSHSVTLLTISGSEDNKKRIKSPMVAAEEILVGQTGIIPLNTLPMLGFVIIDPRWVSKIFADFMTPENTRYLQGPNLV
jgi:hypothetical protein